MDIDNPGGAFFQIVTGGLLGLLLCSYCAATGPSATGLSDSFDAEKALISSCLSLAHQPTCTSVSSVLYVASIFDDFTSFRSDLWERVQDHPLEKGDVSYKENSVICSIPSIHFWCNKGLRTRERLISIPQAGGGSFLVRVDVDTSTSKNGALIFTPRRYEQLYKKSQIRLSYRKGEKVGEFRLDVDGKDMGAFKVPLLRHYPVDIRFETKRVSVLDKMGKVAVSAGLSSWSPPGTTLYLLLCAVAGPELGEGAFRLNSLRLRHPLVVRKDTCLAWNCLGDCVMKDNFSNIDMDVWTKWTEGGASPSIVTTSNHGLRFSVGKDRGWGRYGLAMTRPLVRYPEKGRFCTIEMLIDTEFSSGARMALVTSPRDSIWRTPHIRLGIERRGLVSEAWLGDEQSISGSFNLPKCPSCRVTLLVGHYGVYAIGPGCRLRASMPRPAWLQDGQKLYLVLYSQAPRPDQQVSLGVRSIRIANHRSYPRAGSGAGLSSATAASAQTRVATCGP